jgi:integrase
MPKLRKKKVREQLWWYTDAGGSATYFGKVDEVPFADANKQFAEHITNLSDGTASHKRGTLTAGELMDAFLGWMQANRSGRSYGGRKTHCNRFGAFKVDGKPLHEFPADRVRGSDLEKWLAHLKAKGYGAQTRRHAATSIRHCWNWATKHCPDGSNTKYLSPSFRPFSGVEQPYVPPKLLTEDKLMTKAEREALFAAAEIDLDTLHRFGQKTSREGEANPYRAFADMLRCYHATGARTDELVQCRVEDVQFRTGQVVLGKHKRSKTQREPTIRNITLNSEALAIFKRLCDGKKPSDFVFLHSDRKPYHRRSIPERFNRVKEVAALKELGTVRDEITIYSFRDLWISEALMAGVDIATVARMAGTSIAMIERVYGHFRNSHLHDAQAKVDKFRKQNAG